MRTHVLFLAEAVTWSQVVRLVTLANGLDRRRYRVTFASATFDPRLFAGTDFARESIFSLSPAEIDARVRRGGRIYDRATLTRYVDEELRLFDRLQPDVVVSDLRWSTTISAPVASVPLATLIDAYWFRAPERFPIPDHPVVRWLGVERVSKGFAIGLPHVLRYFAKPVNQLRRAHGLPELGDLRDVLGFGDRLLFPDDPSLVPSDRDGVFLGPVPWAPREPLPAWWSELGEERPVVYVTMGSSGALDVVPKVLTALEALDVDVVLSTASRFQPETVPDNVRVVDAIAGDAAARKASVVVCSGGASTGWQALAEGRPVVGIPSNLDACLAMSCVEEAGAGVMLRPAASADEVRTAIVRALRDPQMRAHAETLGQSSARLRPHARFDEALLSLMTLRRTFPPEAPCA
jgi:UDP:flavonoid glycosyltransferase YjiC (YdhE family)